MKRNNVPAHCKIGETTHYYKSKAERRYACFLQWLKEIGNIAEWQYEPKTFWFEGIKRGCVSYKPDFMVKLASGLHHWVEVKGYMDSKSKTKLARFKRYFPEERLTVIDGTWFKRNSPKLKGLVPGWE
jgi:hypothetical protein